MTTVRELLAIALGTALGLALLAAPRAAVRLSVFVGPNRRRRGDYGADDPVPDQWVWIVRGLGVGCLIIATYIAYQTFA